MTRTPSPPGTAPLPRKETETPTSTRSHQDATPTSPSSESPSEPTRRSADSLYALGIQAQYIDGEIALAAEMLESDDPEQEATAVAVITEYLEAAAHTKSLLADKADRVCTYIDHLEAVARYRKDQAARLAALAAADAKRAEQLKSYMTKVLTALNPDQTKFSLPTHELRSRKSTSVVIDSELDIPTEFLSEKISYSPDKTAIKTALKQGESVPGCRLQTNTSWTIK